MQRDAGWGDDKLGPGGWQSSDALLQPNGAEASGGDLLLHVGWEVCRHLEAGVYEFSVPGAGLEQAGLSWPDIVPQYEGVSRPPDMQVATVEAPPAPKPPTPPAAMITPVLTSMPSGMTPDPARPALVVPKWATTAASLIVALLLAGGAAYYWHNREPARTEEAQAVPPADAAAPALDAPPAQAAAGLGGLSVPDVLTRAPNPAAIAAEGERRLRSDRRDDGLLLLEAAADRADPAAAAALGRLYDPVLFQPGGAIPRPDPRQAARYYRDAARGGADVTAMRAALQRNLQAHVQAGDLGASLSLKDFWP